MSAARPRNHTGGLRSASIIDKTVEAMVKMATYPREHVHVALVVSSIFLIPGHVVMAVLGLTNHMEFTRPSGSVNLENMAGAVAFTPLHLVAGLALCLAAFDRLRPGVGAAASLGVNLAWGGLNMAWAVRAAPVSWVGPALALVMGAGALALTVLWEGDRVRRRE